MGLAIAAVQAVQKSIEHIAVVVIPFSFCLYPCSSVGLAVAISV